MTIFLFFFFSLSPSKGADDGCTVRFSFFPLSPPPLPCRPPQWKALEAFPFFFSLLTTISATDLRDRFDPPLSAKHVSRTPADLPSFLLPPTCDQAGSEFKRSPLPFWWRRDFSAARFLFSSYVFDG